MKNNESLERIQLNNPLYIGKGEKRIYENKHLSLKGEMIIDGTLQFKDCIIDAADCKIKVNGKLHMESCEVRQLGSEFLEVALDATAVLMNSEFDCKLPFNDSVIIARNTRDFLIQNCKFHGSPLVISMLTKRHGCSVLPFTVPFVDTSKGKIYQCEFTNFSGCRVANVLYLIDTTFENCHRIEVGGSGEKTKVARCCFVNCKEINVYDGKVECCEFRNVETVLMDKAYVIGCSFSELKCDFDHIIFLEDSNVENCKFVDACLTKDSYLIEATSESFLEHCSFKNCRTSRADLELIHCEEEKGVIFKKTVEYDIVDHETCMGLDAVEWLMN